MLTTLSIRNLAVIEAIDAHFYRGFHVLTGETGAGKSIIIDALGLLAGGRGSADLIRYGCDKAEIEALFELQEGHPIWATLAKLGIEGNYEEHLVIRREITSQGKSISRINGQLVNLTMLREVGDHLINIHGQHEHQSLLRPESHLFMLDTYGERTIAPLKDKYQQQYSIFIKVEKELRELQENSQKAFQMLDLYQFQLEEIATADLKIGEDEWLVEERVKLSHSEKMMDSVTGAYDILYGQHGISSMSSAVTFLKDIVQYDEQALKPLLEQLQSAYFQLEDVTFQLRDYREQIEFNPERLEEIEQRIDKIITLRRKYGDSIEQIMNYYESIKKEVDLMEHKDEHVEQLRKRRDDLFVDLLQMAFELSQARKQCANDLGVQIEGELKDLQMERTSLKVKHDLLEDPRGYEIEGHKVRLTKQGIDNIEFMISPNPGEPLRPLGKIASGGELSRIMLAMKTIFARHDRIPVLIFDEVDTGVSGRAAQSIAEKLFNLSEECQVFSITHLPQVACMADHHYLIEKNIHDGRTMTSVNHLTEVLRVEELARMLGGVEITTKTRHHAKEMLKLAEARKAGR
ncbi:DNA repair protein RecN [Paenibacillus sp. CMAA1364]